MLRSFGAVLDKELGQGVYWISSGWRIGLVIVRELSETPETLWLRGLGKDEILSEAFSGIRSLPETKRERNDIVEVCIKHFKYLIEKSVTDLSEEEGNFMKTMQEIDILYQAEMGRIRSVGQEEGRAESDRASLEAMIIFKFGAIDPELEQVLPKLLLLAPFERTQQVMTLSREALLELR
jgi:hypothetical protein